MVRSGRIATGRNGAPGVDGLGEGQVGQTHEEPVVAIELEIAQEELAVAFLVEDGDLDGVETVGQQDLAHELALLVDREKVLAVGGYKIQAGRMSTGDLFTFAILIYQLTFPTFIMGWVFALVQRGAAAMQRIDEILATEPSIADRPDRVEVDALRGPLCLRCTVLRQEHNARPQKSAANKTRPHARP